MAESRGRALWQFFPPLLGGQKRCRRRPTPSNHRKADALPRAGEEWGEETRFPTEEDVLDLTAAWGIDPRFGSKQYPAGVGIICE